jgi:hypothetical protein
LQNFVAREGHARVPQVYREKDGYPLGGWVAAQRRTRTNGRLSDDRARRLEALPGWSWKKSENAWDDGYARLKRFVEREGHAGVPTGYHEDGYPLGTWVTRLRRLYRKGTLNPERRARLEALPGWTWDPRQAAWEAGFARLQSFIEREGHARVPTAHYEDRFRARSMG